MKTGTVLTVAGFVLFSYLIGFVLGSIATGAFESLPQNFLAPQTLSGLPAEKYSASTYIAAVDSRQKGILNKAEVEIIDGKGRVLFNTNPFVEPDTQFSLETAAKVAFAFTQTSMDGKDVIFSVSHTPAQLIGGPSAGGAFAVLTVAAIKGKKVREGVAMTGTIESNGSIGAVGGVIEKATAASEKGIKLFLIPKGQGTVTFYREEVSKEQRGFITIRRTRLVPEQMNLNDYAKENLGIEIREVANLKEAIDLMVE